MQALAERDHRGQIDIACLHPAIMSKIVQRCSWAGEIFDLSGARRTQNSFVCLNAFLLIYAPACRQTVQPEIAIFCIPHPASNLPVSWHGLLHRIGLAGHAADMAI